MSETRAPGRTASIAFQSDSSVTRSRSAAFGAISPDADRHRRVAEKPAHLRAEVDRNDVALAQHRLRRRDAVHDLLVHRRANRRRIALVALERRHRAARANLALGKRIELFGRHARRHRFAQLLEHVADQLVHLAQPPKLRRRSADDHRPPPRRDRHHRVDARRQLRRDLVGRLRAVDRPERRPAAVVVEQRPALARVHLEAMLPHVLVAVVGARDHLAAAALAGVVALGADPGSAFAAHLPHTRRPCIRCSSSASGTARSMIDQRLAPAASDRAPRPAAPSAETRRECSRWRHPARASRSSTMPIISSSPSSSPRSINAFARSPSSLPLCAASRRMSPVEILGMPRACASRTACVPFTGRGRSQHDDVQAPSTRAGPGFASSS